MSSAKKTLSSNIKLQTLPSLPNPSMIYIRRAHGSSAHRVIPNILMQGGCPGFGTPDDDAPLNKYIKCERR